MREALQYSAQPRFPSRILAVWSAVRGATREKTASRALLFYAIASAGTIIALFWLQRFSPATLARATAYNGAFVLALGAAVMLAATVDAARGVFSVYRHRVDAMWGGVADAAAPKARSLPGVAAHLVLLMVLFAFLLFARFRLADLFIRYTVRILLAALWAGFLTESPPRPRLGRCCIRRNSRTRCTRFCWC